MTPRERRTLLVAATLLLAASLVRYGYERRSLRPLLPPDSAGVRDELLAATRRARAEAELRRRPLADGERIDPNRASAAELDRLPGVGPSVADAVVREREEGGWFAGAHDLRRVRGIGPATSARIAPHLDWSQPPPVTRGRAGRTAAGGTGAAAAPGFRPLVAARGPPAGGPEEAPVDLNRAGPDELRSLRGIGPALAERILEARRARGGFDAVDELLEVRGIGPATLEGLRERVRVRP